MKYIIFPVFLWLLASCHTADPDIHTLTKRNFVDAKPPAMAGERIAGKSIRFATYNTSLYSEKTGGLIERLQADDASARKIAAVIQHQRPDVLLLNEFDYDAEGIAADVFQRKYLGQSQDGQKAISYPYHFIAPVNTGVQSGMDLDNNGKIGGDGRDRGNDAFGYGLHPGQYGMLVLSRFPINVAKTRTFQNLLWKDLPGATIPKAPATGQAWYPPEVWERLRLSSKSHWDVPIETPNGTVHFLVSHLPAGF